MPTLQVIGREAVDDQNNRANQAIEQQKMVQNAIEKAVQFKQMSEELKLKAKANENEVEKNRILKLSARMDYISKTYDIAAKYTHPEAVIGHMLKISGDEVVQTMSDPDVRGMTGNLQSVEGQKGAFQQALADKLKERSGTPGQAPASPNQPQMNRLSNEPIITDYNANGATVNFPQDIYNQKMTETMATQAGQPYSSDVSNALAFEKSSKPVFEELYKKIDDLKGNMGIFGGAKMAAGTGAGPGAAYMRFAETSKQRELANLLNRVKQIAFTYGGKTLSPTEQQRVDSSMDPTNKTTKQWKEGLQWAYERLSYAAKLQSTPRGMMDQSMATPQPTLPGNAPTGSNDDPAGIFGGR